MSEKEKLFNQLYPEIKQIVEKRRSSWVLTTLPWEDVSSILISRIWIKLDTYDSSRPFENWANRLITHAIKNLLRDNLYKWSRPCIRANSYGNPCVYNQGSNRCGWTKSGEQDSTCPAFAAWKAKKQAQANINTPLALENHIDETNNRPCNHVDIESSKEVIDEKMMERLDKNDANLYKMLFIQHLSINQISKKLKYTEQDRNRLNIQIVKAKRKFKIMASEIIKEFDLA